MKNRIAKRLLAGCLAAMLLFGDTAGVLALELSGTEIAEVQENTEAMESATEVDGTEAVEVQTESTEKEEFIEATEFVEETEVTELVEETETVEILTEEPEQLQTAVVSEYTGPIYKAYLGLSETLTPKVAEGCDKVEWNGEILFFGDKAWRILDPAAGLLGPTGIFLDSETLYKKYNDACIWDTASVINTALNDYINLPEVTVFSEIERGAISEIRLMTLDEATNAAYGFYNPEGGYEGQDSTKVMCLADSSYNHRLYSDDTEDQIWVEYNGTICRIPYSEDEDTLFDAITGTLQGGVYGYAPVLKLNKEEIFMTLYTGLVSNYTKVDISSIYEDRTWRVLLKSEESGFEATAPEAATYSGQFTVEITELGTGTYDKACVVLVDENDDVVFYDDLCKGLEEPAEGKYTVYLREEIKPGTYEIKIFGENSEESYVSNIVESELKVQTVPVTNIKVSGQVYGKNTLYWELADKRTDQPGTYTYCNIYRSESEDGPYTEVASNVACDNSDSYYTWSDEDVRASENTAENGVYYYKIATLTEESGTEGEHSAFATNKDMYYGEQELEGYKGAFVVDKNKNKLTGLTLHEGEAIELQLAFVPTVGEIEYLTSDELGGASWYLHKDYATTDNYREQPELSVDKLVICPYEIVYEDEDGDGTKEPGFPEYKVYLQAGDDAEGTYYLTTRIYQKYGYAERSRYWQIPVTVVAAEEGKDYEQATVLDVVTTQEEAEQKLRDFMVARDNESLVLVESGVTVDPDSIFDTYAEREGMKPNEGDYLFYQVGYTDKISFIWSPYDRISIDFNGGYYEAYWSTAPFITTAEQEAQVDDYINALVHNEGGALYQYAHGTATDEQKIKAIYDWIITNVNPSVPGDRRTPIYHTVYHTLFGAYGGYPGSGTCGAFAVLFTRLSREMGIPSKVIMGTDAAAHAYNIVKLGNKWYFIDTNSRRYLSDEDNFSRAQEQSYYLDSRFIASYLSKIPGNDYYVPSKGVAIVTGTDGTVSNGTTADDLEKGGYTELSRAVDYIMEQAAKEGNESVEYTITVKDGDMAFPETAMNFYGGQDENCNFICYDDRVTIDLGGNTLIIRDGLGAKIAAKKVHNGVISVGDAAVLELQNNAGKVDSVYEDLRIVFKSTQGAVDNTPGLQILNNTDKNVMLKDSVSLDEFSIVEIRGNAEIYTDLSVRNFIQLQDLFDDWGLNYKILINGTLTVGAGCNIYAGNYEIDKFISKGKTIFYAPAYTKLTINEEMSLAGTTAFGADVGNTEFGFETGTVELALKRQFASADDVTPTEQATVSIAGNITNKTAYMSTAMPMFHFIAKDYVGEELQANTAFGSGTTIGTVTAKGVGNVTLTSANLDQYITVEVIDDGKSFADIEGSTLAVVSESVKVTEESTGNTKSFSSLKKAIDGLANVAGKAEGTYTFTFTENTALSANVTLPAYVKEAIFAVSTEENSLTDVEVDFKGYTLTSSGGITVDAGVHLVNQAATNGKLVSTKKTDITDYAIGLWEDVEGINLSAVNGVLMLVGDEDNNTISGDVTAKDIIVRNTWEVEGTVANSGLHNIGTFICDTFTQKSTNQTNLEKDSVLVVKTKADIYNVTCVFADEGKNPAIYQMANATVSLNGKLVSNNGKITYGVLAENDAEVDGLYDTFKDLEAQQALFTTNIKVFPVEGIELQQASATPRYITLLQKGTKMVVVGEWIVVKTRGVDGTKDKEEVLKKFTNWKEASDYIATLSNSTMTYVVEITDNLVMDETLTMPAKAAGIIFRGAGYEEGGKVTVTYANALKLVTDTTFENITLANLKSVNGKNLSLVDAELTVSGAVALTGTLFMENATLDSNSKINVVNVISNSADNRILYGGNASSNILTITGTVTAGPDLTGDGAIDVTAKAIANSTAGYTEGITLMNAAKASATWFTADGAATYKSGKVIKYGSVEGTVALQVWDESVGEYIDLGEFVTFQQAIDEINQLADAKAEYRILLLENIGDATKAITTPTKAAHVTISGGDSVKTLTYKNSLALKSNVTLEKIALNPVAASNSIAGNKFDLELVESDIYVGGAVSNIRTLTLENATLIATGDITATDVINPSGTAKIVATATLTRKNGVITKVAPKFTINGTAMIFGEGIEVVLSEKATADYVAIDFSKEEAVNVCASGIPFVKASKLTSDSLVLSAENFAEGTMITVVKSAGYLAGIVGNAGATLSYEDEDGNLIVSRMLHFADAVTEINNLKTKRDYTITLYDAYTAPKAIAMPNKNYVSTLTIEGTGDYVELFHNGNITLTSPTIIGGVYFKKTGATENPAAITFSTGGYALTVAGKVYFNTPVNFNGGKKGTLDVTDEGQLFTITNDVEMPAELHEQFICGGVTNFAEVNVKTGQMLKISEYTVISGKTAKTTAATLDVTTLNNAGEVAVVGTKAGTVKVTNANLDDGCLTSNGTLSVTNMTLEGDANVVVDAAGAFSVTGKLISKTDKAVLYTRQNAKGVPNLTINGTVTLENSDNRIGVGVYAADGSGLVKLQSTPGAKNPNLTAQLLTAKTATADMFVPVNGNVGVDAYPVENGYFLQKSGTAICVYYADEVAVAVCEGNADTGDLETAEVLGYYASFKDAVTAIDAWKDKNAEYTIILLEDVNTAAAPAGITLPTQAANVIITSRDEEMYNIFYTGNITLKAPTEFVKVCFNPMNTKKQGAASNFAAGNYDLTLRDVEVGSTSGMKINNITGSAKQVTTLAVEELVVYGGVTNSKELIIEKPVTINGAVKATAVTIENGTADKENVLTAKGAFTTDNLVMQGFTVVDATGTLTIKDIFNETTENIGEGQTNTICYGKNSKGAPNLTVKGVVSGENPEKVIFNYNVNGATVANYTLAMQSGKYTLSDKQKLATLEKAALSEISFQLAGAKLGDKLAVKANKGVYVVAENANGALLEISNASGVTTSNCLDYSQAVNEINNIADKTADYTIYVGITDADVTDTNLTDKNAVSAITMPKKNTAASVTVAADAKESMTYTGNIAYPGELIFENITLAPKGDSSISGTKNVSTVTLIDGTATFKNISNVKELTLDNADLLTNGTVAVTDVILSGVSQWDALAKTTVSNLDASQMSDGSYLASKQDAKTLVPMFTISSGVTVDALGTPVAWKVLTSAAVAGNLTEVSQYKNTSLVVAPKEDADKFVAWPFRASNIGNEPEGITAETLTEYKTIKNEVVNGDKSEMVVRIIQTHDGVAGQAVTYAKSFDEAVTIINNIGDTTASYRMELLQGSLADPIKTTKNGTAYGKLTLPTKAADVTIAGANEEATVVMLYTGTLAINCDTTFDNIALSEGTLKNGEFIKNHNITPSYKGAYELTFTDSVQTLWNQNDGAPLADIVLASASIAKGTLALEGVEAYVTGAFTVNDLEITGANYLTIAGKTAITNILDGDKTNDEDSLRLAQYFTKTTKATQKSATQLAINGEIESVDVFLASYVYDFGAKSYHGVTAAEISNQKFATMPKASIDNVILLLDADISNSGQNFIPVEEGNLYKQGSALYYTTEPLVVRVVAQDEEGNEVYVSDFLTWEEAVKEIDKRADKKADYQMILLESIEEPIKTLTLPSKADEVTVTSEAGEENYVLFTTNKITLKCNTDFENVGLSAVKKPKGSIEYSSIAYTIAGGNFELGLSDMQYEMNGYYSMPSTISGGAKGTLTVVLGSEAENSIFAVDKISGFGTVNVYNETEDDAIASEQVESVGVVTKGMSGIGTLNVYPGAIVVSDSGTITVKNANICGGAVIAKDITVSQTAKLESAILMAGSEAANDGKLKLKDIVVTGIYNEEYPCNYISAEQDKNGKSQIAISGTVKAADDYVGLAGEPVIVVDLYYNNYSTHAKLCEGMVLINATKADAEWFAPAYTTYDEEEGVIAGMGYEEDGYGLYNTKKEIVYGALAAEH